MSLPKTKRDIETRSDDHANDAEIVGATKAVEELRSAVADHRKATDEKLATELRGLTERLDGIETRIQRPANDNRSKDAAQLERRALAALARTGNMDAFNAEVRSLNVATDPDGGYFVLPTVESGIRTILRDQSPFRAMTSPVTIGTDSYQIPLDISEVAGSWVSEQASRPETSGPDFRIVEVPVHELYAAPRITQKLLDDASVDLGGYLEQRIGERFGRLEGAAFISGTGVGEPKGILAYDTSTDVDFTRAWGTLQHVAAGATSPTDDQLAKALVKLSLTLRAPYRAGARWLMSSTTAVRIRQIQDSNKRFMWQDGLQDGQPDRLLGFPVEYDESLDDVSANKLPVAFANWPAAYQIVDRHGLRLIRDNLTAKPHTIFYAYRRVGGAVVDCNAIKFLKISA